MELYDESTIRQNNKNKKLANIILIFIIILFLAIIGILAVMVTIKSDTLNVYLNGTINENLKSILIFEDNDSKVYIPIKKVANLFGYNSYNGDYIQPSENASKCYVESENEITNFSLNSNTIYKIIPNSNYEYIQIDEPVKAINGELYTTIDGIQKAFNVSFSYDEKNKEIKVYTLDHLLSYYTNNIVNIGYTGVDSTFNNQKAMLENMLVVENNQKYGVINSTTGEVILDTKYDEIKYLNNTSDFLVKSNNKVGIISKDKQTKVNIIYDSIELLDYDSNLYIIAQDNKYGILDANGNIKLYPEYEKIGIDSTVFKNNNVKNGNIILDTLIPVQKDKLWGLFNKSGEQIVEFKYEDLGYIKNEISNNLLIIPECNVIVVKKDDKYNLITLNGKEVFNIFVDNIYKTIESGETKYYMTYNDQISEVLPLLEKSGIKVESNITEDIETNNNTVTE